MMVTTSAWVRTMWPPMLEQAPSFFAIARTLLDDHPQCSASSSGVVTAGRTSDDARAFLGTAFTSLPPAIARIWRIRSSSTLGSSLRCSRKLRSSRARRNLASRFWLSLISRVSLTSLIFYPHPSLRRLIKHGALAAGSCRSVPLGCPRLDDPRRGHWAPWACQAFSAYKVSSTRENPRHPMISGMDLALSGWQAEKEVLPGDESTASTLSRLDTEQISLRNAQRRH